MNSVTPFVKRGTLATPALSPGMEPWQGVIVEAVFTALICMVYLSATNSKRKGKLYMPNITLGFIVACGVLGTVSINHN